MRLLRVPPTSQKALLAQLAEMPAFLRDMFGNLSQSEAGTASAYGGFSPVEHCWHLADLERDGYAVRINRLLTELNPALPDFDGAQVAKERRYKSLSLASGIQTFRDARLANLLLLKSVSADAWSRSGTQAGVGIVALCDIPGMMADHDAGHRDEIKALVRAIHSFGVCDTHIRPYQDSDEQGVITLWNEALPDTAPHNEPATAIRKKLEVGPELFLVAEIGAVVVGTAMGGYDGHRGWVYSVAVKPQYRRQGIGGDLIRQLEAALFEQGCLKVNLQVRVSNAGAIAFYEKFGYSVEERISMGKLLYS